MPVLVTVWYGTFLLADGDARAPPVAARPAPHEAPAIAARLARLRRGEVLAEEEELARASSGTLAVIETRLAGLGTPRTGILPAPPAPEASGHDEAILHEALLLLAVEEAHGALAGPDLLIVHQVRALDDVIRTMNTIGERLTEWYAVHAPEVVTAVRDHAELARLVAETPDPEQLAAARRVEPSGIGVAAPPPDAALVAEFARGLVRLEELRHAIETRLANAMDQTAPNLAALTGAMLGARLIAAAQGLERLANLPAGTVQTLGAENALFRHLREGAPPPKHGILFQHEAVYKAPWWQRGRIARTLGAKAAQAARMDAYSTAPDGSRGAELAERFRARVAAVQKEKPRPPERPRRGHGPPRRGPPRGAPRGGPQRTRPPRGRPQDDRRRPR